jgi:hypothetical protein
MRRKITHFPVRIGRSDREIASFHMRHDRTGREIAKGTERISNKSAIETIPKHRG